MRQAAFAAWLLAAALAAAPGAAEAALKDSVAAAGEICFLPLSEEPFVLTLESWGEARAAAPLREILIGVEGIREFNQKLRAESERVLGRALADAPPAFLSEKKRLGGTWLSWDTAALPCAFYLEARFENGSNAREATLRLGRSERAEEAAYIPLSAPWTKIALYEKIKPGKKGKKRASADAILLGRHNAEFAPGKRPVDLIKPRVEAILAGRAPADDLDTEYFPWVSEYYAGDDETLAKGFKSHAGKLRERAPGRLLDVVDQFARDLEKWMRK